MQLIVDLDLPVSPELVAPWVESLDAYPSWTGLVHRVAADTEGAGPAWTVELRARIGPLARSKRLRMTRAVPNIPGHVCFERAELDGRQHGRWELVADYTSVGSEQAPRTHLTMTLSYDGAHWAGGLVERTLHDEIERSKARLTQLVSAGESPEKRP